MPPTGRSPAASGYHWGPLLGGGLLTAAGLRSPVAVGVPLAIAGAALLYHGMHGRANAPVRVSRVTVSALDVSTSVTVRRSAEELYSWWRDFRNLPSFMRHLQTVVPLAANRYRFEAQVPALATTMDWEVEVVEDRPNERIRWRTPGDSPFMHTGTVTFRAAPGTRGTEVGLSIAYRPAGIIAGGISPLLRTVDALVITEELRRFKRIMETGEIPTTEGQPSG